MTVLSPTIRLLPPATTTLAVASIFVPVMVTVVVPFGTFTVYARVPVAKLSIFVPSTSNSLKLALLLFALTTVTV
ncbi:hypothetical protein D3C73_1474070 [compost metagenome]